MQGGENAGSCGKAVLQIIYKNRVGFFRIRKIRITCFLWEGNGIQPVQKFQVHGRAAIAVLRRVQVQVDQARRDDAAGVVKDFHPGGRGAAEPGAQAVLAQQIALAHAQCVWGGGVYKGAFQGETIHRNDLSI